MTKTPILEKFFLLDPSLNKWEESLKFYNPQIHWKPNHHESLQNGLKSIENLTITISPKWPVKGNDYLLCCMEWSSPCPLCWVLCHYPRRWWAKGLDHPTTLRSRESIGWQSQQLKGHKIMFNKDIGSLLWVLNMIIITSRLCLI